MKNKNQFDLWCSFIKENLDLEPVVDMDVDLASSAAIKTDRRSNMSIEVDNIMSSLELLASKLTEDQNKILNNINIVLSEEYVAINEAENQFLANIMKMVKSMKAYAVIKAAYPKLKQQIVDAEVEKVTKLGEFDMNSDQIIAQQLEKIKEKFKEALQQVTDSDAPTAVKKAKKDKIRAMRDEAIKDGSSKSATKKVAVAKKNLELKLAAVVRDAKADLSSAEDENKIESENLKTRWEKEKLEIDDRFDILLNNSMADAEMQFYDDNPEAQEKIMAKTKKAIDAAKRENAEKRAELEADLQELEAEQEELANKGDEKQKEANQKIKEFYKSGREYVAILNSIPDDTKDLTAEDKKEFTDKRKAYNSAKSNISIITFKNSDPSLSEDDAEEMFTIFTDMIQKQVDEHKTKASTIKDEKSVEKESGDANKEESGDANKEKINDLESEITRLKDDLASENEKETPDDEKVAEIEGKITAKNTELERLKSTDNNSLIIRAKAAGLNELAVEIASRPNWQVFEGTALYYKYNETIKKKEYTNTLNENKYLNLSIKEKFNLIF